MPVINFCHPCDPCGGSDTGSVEYPGDSTITCDSVDYVIRNNMAFRMSGWGRWCVMPDVARFTTGCVASPPPVTANGGPPLSNQTYNLLFDPTSHPCGPCWRYGTLSSNDILALHGLTPGASCSSTEKGYKYVTSYDCTTPAMVDESVDVYLFIRACVAIADPTPMVGVDVRGIYVINYTGLGIVNAFNVVGTPPGIYDSTILNSPGCSTPAAGGYFIDVSAPPALSGVISPLFDCSNCTDDGVTACSGTVAINA